MKKIKTNSKKYLGLKISTIAPLILIVFQFIHFNNPTVTLVLQSVLFVGLALCALIIYKDDPWASKIFACVSVLFLTVLKALLPHKLFAVGSAVLFIAIIAYFIYRIANKKADLVMGIIGTCLFVLIYDAIIRLNYITYQSGALTPYWYIGLILGVIVGVAVVLKFFKKSGFLACLGVFALTTFLCFATVWITTDNLNYGLDFSEPQMCVGEIEKKDLDYNRRYPDTYEFKFTLNGDSFYLDVPRSVYIKYDVGDEFAFYLHKGALGEPFYSYYP